MKFTIRAEKCPNRSGVEAVLKQLQGDVIPFADVAKESLSAMWFTGGYPDPGHLDALRADRLEGAGAARRAGLVADGGDRERRSTSSPRRPAFEKDGTFVNHANYAQTFGRAARPPQETRTELQLAFDLLGRRGLVQPDAIRKELAKAVPFFGALNPETRLV